MRTNSAGIKLIREFEGCRLSAYKCPAGIWTIGFGTTKDVKAGMTITAQKAEEFLRRDLTNFELAVANSVLVPLTENQFSSLVCFVYNIGIGAFSSSTMLKKLNAKDYTGASNEFLRWNKANGKVLEGLTRRRKAEQLLFNQH